MNQYKVLLDVPAIEPALGFDAYATALADIVQTSDSQFAVGIFGGWGSGKTTLMRRIERKLDQDQVIPVWFSAWRYEKEEHLIIPLLDTVREALVEWADRHDAGKQAATDTAETIGKVMYSLLAGVSMKLAIPQVLEMSFDANKALTTAQQLGEKDKAAKVPRSFYHASFRALNAAFAQFMGGDESRRIVVFVDDLDRCLPESALDVLESMKLFFDLHGFIFVVALDRRVVEAAIDAKYLREGTPAGDGRSGHRIVGADYIKKIFQVPFSLLPVSSTEIRSFLHATAAGSKLPPDQVTELSEKVIPHLEYLVTDSGVNPREVKRYINAYTLLRRIKPGLRPELVLALQTIEFRPDWSLVREGLYAYRDVFTQAVRDRVNGTNPSALSDLDPRFDAIPGDFFEYVSGSGPAKDLLNVPMLDEYIYAGEATKTPSTTRPLADSIRTLASLRGAIAAAAVAEPDSPPVHALQEALNRFVVGGISEGPPDPFTLSASQGLRQIEASLREIPIAATERSSWIARNNQAVTAAIAQLVQGAR